MLILDVVGERIADIEILYRDDIKHIIETLVPD